MTQIASTWGPPAFPLRAHARSKPHPSNFSPAQFQQSESNCSCSDGVEQPIVRVHRPTWRGHSCSLQAPLSTKRNCSSDFVPNGTPQDCITEFHFRVGNRILANCHSGEQYYNPLGRTWKPLILASQLRVANVYVLRGSSAPLPQTH